MKIGCIKGYVKRLKSPYDITSFFYLQNKKTLLLKITFWENNFELIILYDWCHIKLSYSISFL